MRNKKKFFFKNPPSLNQMTLISADEEMKSNSDRAEGLDPPAP